MIRNLFAASVLAIGAATAMADDIATNAQIVEIATMSLGAGVSPEDFAEVDARVEQEHVSQQPGFVARETGATADGWVAIVYWASAEDAQASMDSFATAPAAAEFMSMVDPESIVMTRYRLNR